MDDHSADDVDLSTSADIDRLRVALIRVSRRIRTQARGDFSPSQLAVLGTIINHEPLTNSEIAEREHVRASTTSKIVDTLERAGLVRRTPDPDDRRRVQISVTDDGQVYADEVRAAGRTWLARQLEALDAGDVAIIGAAVPALERLLIGEPD
ncbi:MAG: MarR family transcriptional regulator [Ilumatobacter sp.]|nr:MarR family transcriptional regulator [Ilumatobacter sp.]